MCATLLFMDQKKAMLAGAGLFVLSGLPCKIDVSTYEIETAYIHEDVRLCVLSDLHSCRFGKKQRQIRKILEKYQPDIILMPGDIIDDLKSDEAAFELFEVCRPYETYYSPGNHEARLPDEKLEEYWMRMEEMGIRVLIDDSVYDRKRGIEIAGLHSLPHHVDCSHAYVNTLFHHEGCRILMSHRPCFPSFYEGLQCDLVVSGHAHGGQWRIPFIHQGLYAPQEGIFPKYTEGVHALGNVKLCVSRGLNRSAYYIPRLFNNPEIVFIDLERRKRYETAAERKSI